MPEAILLRFFRQEIRCARFSLHFVKSWLLIADAGPTYCIDYEMHESLVTAMPGTPPAEASV